MLRRKLKPAVCAIFASFFFQMYNNMGLCRVATACLYVAALYEHVCGLIPTQLGEKPQKNTKLFPCLLSGIS